MSDGPYISGKTFCSMYDTNYPLWKALGYYCDCPEMRPSPCPVCQAIAEIDRLQAEASTAPKEGT